ncbi:MAG: LysE family translocator [Pseudomonadota bacterium]
MPDLANLMTILAAFFVAAASPGPAVVALATVSMRSGRKTGMMFGMGLSLGLAIWGIVAATGLGALLQASSQALFVLKILGGVYLLWLAFGIARSTSKPMGLDPAQPQEHRNFLRGLLLNLSNPKAVFAWMAVLALGLGEGSTLLEVGLATFLCVTLGSLIYAFYAIAFSTAGAMSFYNRIRRWIEGAVAGLFAIAGLGLIRSAFVKSP